MGMWTSFCPICGIHLDINFELPYYNTDGDIISYFSKENYDNIFLKKSKDKDKLISNFKKFMKIKKNTFNKYNKNTILLPNTLPQT